MIDGPGDLSVNVDQAEQYDHKLNQIDNRCVDISCCFSVFREVFSEGFLLRGKLRAAETAAYFRRYSLPDCACGHQTAHNHYDERRASVTC